MSCMCNRVNASRPRNHRTLHTLRLIASAVTCGSFACDGHRAQTRTQQLNVKFMHIHFKVNVSFLGTKKGTSHCLEAALLKSTD